MLKSVNSFLLNHFHFQKTHFSITTTFSIATKKFKRLNHSKTFKEEKDWDMSKYKRKTVSALIIGDEILTGKIRDSNGYTLAKQSFEWGLEFKGMEVIADVKSEIVESVLRLSKKSDFVITSGGIGPTHDDITYESIASAFDRKLELDSETVDLMRIAMKAKGHELNEDRLRMATLPTPYEKVYRSKGYWVPLVQVSNVFILPGIPTLFNAMLQWIEPVLAPIDSRPPPKSRSITYTHMFESDIAKKLRDLDSSTPGIAIGSYPTTTDPRYKVKLTIEGDDPQLVATTVDKIDTFVNGFRSLRELTVDESAAIEAALAKNVPASNKKKK